MIDAVSTTRKPHSDDSQWYLVIHRVPFWFLLIQNLCSRRPLWIFYQGWMLWWYEKLDAYRNVHISITDAEHQKIADYWEHQP